MGEYFLKIRGPANLAGAWAAQPVPASPRPPRAAQGERSTGPSTPKLDCLDQFDRQTTLEAPRLDAKVEGPRQFLFSQK